MSPVEDAGFTSPLIAGADDPIHRTQIGGSGEDAFPATDSCDYDTNSPDTLQSLTTSNKEGAQLFVSPNDLTSFHVSTSPNDSSFHEYSSDSAESSRKGDRTSPPPNDAAMDGLFDQPMDVHSADPFSSYGIGETPSFTTLNGMEDSSNNDGLSYDFNDAGVGETDIDFSTNFGGDSTVTPGDTIFRHGTSPTSEEFYTKHNRQHSQCSAAESVNYPMTSREVSPASKALGSHQSTPSAILNTPSPPAATQGFSPHTFSHNGLLTTQQQWLLPTTVAHVADPVGSLQSSQGGPSTHGRSATQHRVAKVNGGRQQNQPVFHFGSPQLSIPLPRTQLIIKPIPSKSRVETQIRLSMIIKYPPPGVTRLHLPTHTISKPKLQIRPPLPPSPNTLELSVSLVCTSAMAQPDLKQRALARAAANPQRYLPPLNDEDQNSPQNGAEVRICQNCIGRERKRAARKKVKQLDAEQAWCEDEAYRVVVFNTHEMRELKPDTEDKERHLNGAVFLDAPVRIACYCRHHGEKLGFNMIFTLKDAGGRLVAQGMSDAIMITDDHKTAPMSLVAQSSMLEQAESGSIASATASEITHAVPEFQDIPTNLAPQQQTQPQSQAQASPSAVFSPASSHASGQLTRPLSRPASPTQGGPSKKRKSSNSRVPNTLTMTKMEAPSAPSQMPQLATVSPLQAPLTAFAQQPDPIFSPASAHGSYGTNPPTPSAVEQTPFFAKNRSASVDNLAMAQFYSAPASNHPSRAPSPNGMMNIAAAQVPNQISQAMANSFHPVPISNNQPRPPPIIHKVIPGEGSRLGGTEVTILGTSFFQGIDVYFGAVRAVTTTYWGESSLVCLLPPSPVAGVVQVTCQHSAVQPAPNLALGNSPVFFRYIDDSENQLMRLALQCVGSKTFGADMDVSALARHVIDAYNNSQGGSSGGEPPSGGSVFNQASSDSLELQLLKCLDVIDLDDSPHDANLNRKSPSGHTMLHLACSLGFRRLVAGLLARGANANALDNGHFTPLHIAAVHDQPEIARRLILAGANPRAYSLSNALPLEMAQSGAAIRAIRFSERPTRSRSETSLRSRASSVGSSHSLIEPLSQIRTHDEPLSAGEESPEYTSGDFEDEDPDEDNYLSMRRPSRRHSNARSERENQGRFDQPPVGGEDDLVSTANALGAAFKEQLQQQLHQFQQSVALHFQNLSPLPHLPQIPQMPALPGRPVLPDYQAYLQQAPFMRRVTQYMPSMPGTRPEPPTESPDRQGSKMDHRWWDLSSYMSNSSAPPPSYEEIFPQEELDTKQASAAQAAADAEADMKCSRLYDQSSSVSAETPGLVAVDDSADQTTSGIPSVLKIGRKNAITKEQQEQFLRAREARLKRISNDRNLFFIWIPLLVIMICAMMYSYFPSLFALVWAIIHSATSFIQTKASHFIPTKLGRVVEVD